MEDVGKREREEEENTFSNYDNKRTNLCLITSLRKIVKLLKFLKLFNPT